MPIYAFKNTNTDTVEEHKLSLAEYDKFKEENPHLIRHFESADAARVNFRESIKIDGGFREVLQKINKGFGGKMDV